MTGVFTGILNISITATILIAVCILLRTFFRDMPKYVRCIMWIIVLLRLAVPFSIESPFSLLPTKEYVTFSGHGADEAVQEETDGLQQAIQGQEKTTGLQRAVQGQEETVGLQQTASVQEKGKTSSGLDETSFNLIGIFSVVWLAGVILTLIYGLISYIRLRRAVSDAVRLRENIYQADRIGSAFVLGIIRPRIYIPYGLHLKELFMVVNHERAHLSRHDHLIKPLGFIVAAVYWFNPIIWAAYILLCRDIELACDEKVIRKIGYNMKKDYSQTLLDLSVPRKYISACPVAFGEIGTNERVRNILKMKKGKVIVAIAAFLLVGVIGICFLTYPKKEAASKTAGVDEKTSAAVTEDVEKASADETKEDKVSAKTENADKDAAENVKADSKAAEKVKADEDSYGNEYDSDCYQIELPEDIEKNAVINVVFIDDDGKKHQVMIDRQKDSGEEIPLNEEIEVEGPVEEE